MNIYTTTILNTAARATAPDRMDCKSFKTFDAAVEYLIDFLVDEGFIDMSEVPMVEKSLRDDHVFALVADEKELHIDENELCDW